MLITELNYEAIGSSDIESCAIIFEDSTKAFDNLHDFGIMCTKEKDKDGDFLIMPWEKSDIIPRELSENDFWMLCPLTGYIEANTYVVKGQIRKILCFWDEWNNQFYCMELDNGQFYGIAWWTTA